MKDSDSEIKWVGYLGTSKIFKESQNLFPFLKHLVCIGCFLKYGFLKD